MTNEEEQRRQKVLLGLHPDTPCTIEGFKTIYPSDDKIEVAPVKSEERRTLQVRINKFD